MQETKLFSLEYPGQRGLIRDFDQVWGGEIFEIFLILYYLTSLTFNYSVYLRDKIYIFCYPAFRLFQGYLPEDKELGPMHGD